MGYTHYWRQPLGIPAAAWALIQADAAKLIAASPVKLAFDYDETDKAPACSAEEIRFNGLGDDGHETFMLTPDAEDFEFCKTAFKPYDLVVCAVLACAAEHTGKIAVSSDGDVSDWRDGVEWASKVLGRSVPCPALGD